MSAAEATPASQPRHVYLIDGSGFLFRAFHALPPMTRGDGTPVGAVYGFAQMLMKLLAETDADHVAVIFDASRRTFRNDLFPGYKASRPEPPDELIPQFALVREATRAFNVACVEAAGYEADDVIATYTRLAREAGAEVTIVSSDKDLMQLVGDGVSMFDAMKNRSIGEAEVRERFGVGPEKVIDVQALAGDSIDCVPGVPGIGVKTAAQLIGEYGDLETLLERAIEIRQPKRRQSLIEHADNARLSKELVKLCAEVPPPEPLSAFAVKRPDLKAVRDFLEAQSFRSILARIESQGLALGRGAAQPEQAAPSPELPLERRNYTLVQDETTLARWIRQAEAAGTVAIDTETTSLYASRCSLVGIALSLEPGRACYVPLAHVGAPGEEQPRQLDRATALAALKPLLEDPAVLKVGQNVKYDMQVLGRCGIQLSPIDDTMLLSYVLEGGLHGHGTDELAELHLGTTPVTFAAVAGSGRSQVTFDKVSITRACDYAAEDADITLRLHRELKPRLVREHLVSVYETLERPLIGVLAAMEARGILVDADELRGLSAEFGRRLEALEADIHGLAGGPFNIGSPKQLGDVLFERMKVQTGRRGKSGAFATGADILETIAAEAEDPHARALAGRVLDWRQLSKLKTTYADALIQQIGPESGRVHTCYQQAVASTGRLSSSDPNLQNIPVRTEEGRKIRHAFIATPGSVLLSADYSQIELRLLAHVAGIEALKVAFRDGIDIHAMTASQVFGVPITGMDPFVRRKAKAINFGIIYGISPFGLARQLGIARSEAAAYIDAYFARYPGIRDYMAATKKGARERGYVTTLFGRRCHVRGITDRNPSVRSFAERAAINAPIQGGAADIIKRAMIRIPKALARAGLKSEMLLQVHDELVFEVPEAEVEAVRALVVDVMTSVADLTVPLVVDTGTGRTWDAAH
ncbi:MAG: DNA polymerase I [Rhodospirillales bacterium]|nr:DNA polymerase I [Rhodospirillales bacterium]